MKLFFLSLPAVFAEVVVVSQNQDLNSSSRTDPIDYDSLYKDRCAESTSTVDKTSVSRVQWAPYTEYTNFVSRTWTTIFPSPTPTSFPTTVKLTHISSATDETWATLSNGSVAHALVTMVVVSFEYETELKTRPTGLAVCQRVGG